ncbi:MAG TPA: DUF5056 domain-containing protein [Verrucomicrobiae bacterium]|nr:DUF5056 domain-containing protein [Verrucomicrobiae bacterium]
MNPPETNDPLDALLRGQNQYVADNGFTARVVAALPRRRAEFSLRQIILVSVVTIGFVLAVLWLPWENLQLPDAAALLSLNSKILLPWVLVLSVMTSLIWAITLAVCQED